MTRTGALRTAVAAGLLCALLAAQPAGAAAHRWRPHVRAAKAYAATRVGVVRFAVRADHALWGWRARSAVHSASVVKAMLLVAYLDRPSVRHRALTDADRALLEPMIRWSDNAAASRVLALAGPDAVNSVARRAGMRQFRLDPVIWGRSLIDAADQTRFFRHIDGRVAKRHRATALRLLAAIVPSQRWGIGAVRPRGWALYFKGGWGSGSGAVEHQVALLRRGSRRVSVAVLTSGSPNHAYATETLRGVFARLLRGLAVRRHGARRTR